MSIELPGMSVEACLFLPRTCSQEKIKIEEWTLWVANSLLRVAAGTPLIELNLVACWGHWGENCYAGRRGTLRLSGHLSGYTSNAAYGMCLFVCVYVCACSQLYEGSRLPLEAACVCNSLPRPQMPGVFLPSRNMNLGAALPAQRSFLLTKQSLCMVHIYPGYIDLSQILTNNQANAL